MLQDGEITSITTDARFGLYYANVVCVSDNQMTLEQRQISQSDAQTIQGLLNKNRIVYYGTQENSTTKKPS